MDKEAPKVLVIGYSPTMSGGVVKVTEALRNSCPGMDLHVFHHCYTPRFRALKTFLRSLLAFAFRLPRIRNTYDVLHIIVGSSGDAVRTLPYIWLAKLAGLPLCIQHHKSSDVVRDHLPALLPLGLVTSTWRRVQAHVFLSEGLKGNFQKVFFAGERLFVIPNAIPETWIESGGVGDLHDRERDIVFFGRWSWEKGVDDLVQAADEWAGTWRCECYTNVQNPTTNGNCQLHPWVDEEEVKNVIRSAKLLILPSYSEAFTTVLLEACASGTPFVASDVAGIPDIVSDSGAGATFPVGNVEAMVTVVRTVLMDAATWLQMAQNGKEWAVTLRPLEIATEWRQLYILVST